MPSGFVFLFIGNNNKAVMPRVLEINSVCGTGSTGKICGTLAEQLDREGNEVRIGYGRGDNVPERYRKYGMRIGNNRDVIIHGIYTRLTDRHGLGSGRATHQFLKQADEFGPDLLWLHNIHGYYLNYELLFEWIKTRPGMQVIWTLHDCWAFTGHCAYFSDCGCDKWKTHCEDCPQRKNYPESMLRDGSFENYDRKKAAFLGVRNMELRVPSHWLESLVIQSFLGVYPIKVFPNEIDHTVFCPRPGDFRERCGLTDHKIVLGVANIWEKRKGLSDFLELAKYLDDSYRIVLVGVTEKQKKALPAGVLGIPRTDSPEMLAEIYTAADVFVNPGVEETFGMTGLEAAACGTKTICYRGTACEEVTVPVGGKAVDRDVEELARAVREACA